MCLFSYPLQAAVNCTTSDLDGCNFSFDSFYIEPNVLDDCLSTELRFAFVSSTCDHPTCCGSCVNTSFSFHARVVLPSGVLRPRSRGFLVPFALSMSQFEVQFLNSLGPEGSILNGASTWLLSMTMARSTSTSQMNWHRVFWWTRKLSLLRHPSSRSTSSCFHQQSLEQSKGICKENNMDCDAVFCDIYNNRSSSGRAPLQQ